MKPYLTDPGAIEEKSMQIIETELGEAVGRFDRRELLVVKRVIHTTADFEYAELLSFSPGAIDAGVKALKSAGAVIAADTNMIISGINRSLLERLGVGTTCLVAEDETRRLAAASGLTRSMVNIRRVVERYPEAIYALGNAPTALHELLSLTRGGRARPALVIGVPVGFVEAVESKEALLESGLGYIATRGRKGGSTVAVAIVNALLRLAGETP